MELLFLFILAAYIIFFVSGIRRYSGTLLQQKKNELVLIQEEYAQLTAAKDSVYDSKLHVEDESMQTFTLFEITKDITKSLNEEEAFSIFKQKLRDNIFYNDCRLLSVDDEKVKAFEQNPKCFLYTIMSHRQKMGYVLIEGLLQREKEKAKILCDQYALSLRRVRLYQEIERTAITDGLTGVYTRRYVQERLKEEIDRSRERQMRFAFLMMDVDHFKKINDTYGHLTGDQILREIGKIIRNNIREIDIPGRFGGEEFCVVLPDTDLDGAQYAAERIRSAVEEAEITAYENLIRATISIGIAIYPRDAKRDEELIDKADWTLYKAKKQGRNRVCFLGTDEKT